MKNLVIAFKKMLGKGRAWISPLGFTSDFLEILVSPFLDLYDYFVNLKYTHFPSKYTDLKNILNEEDLFDIDPRDTLEKRAEDVELSWKMLSGNSSYKTLEGFLQRAGFDVYIIENIPSETPFLGKGVNYGNTQYNGSNEDKKAQYGGHSGRVIGNGFLNIAGIVKDPVQFVDGKSAFYIKGYFDPTDKEWERIIDIVLKFKQAHAVAICQIAERKRADNEWHNTILFPDSIDGGKPSTTNFVEKLNKDGGV